MKAEVEKLYFNELVNISTSLNHFLKKGDDLDVGRLKTVPVDLKQLSHIVDNEVVTNVNSTH